MKKYIKHITDKSVITKDLAISKLLKYAQGENTTDESDKSDESNESNELNEENNTDLNLNTSLKSTSKQKATKKYDESKDKEHLSAKRKREKGNFTLFYNIFIYIYFFP